MKSNRVPERVKILVLSLGLVALAAPGSLVAAPAAPPEKPAEIKIAVSPESARAGDDVRVEVRIEPVSGIKINRYPRIELKVPAVDGVVAAGQTSVGSDKAPPPDRMEENYYDPGRVAPVALDLTLDGEIGAGEHRIGAKLKYYYCVTASGFCTAKRARIEIPVSVE